MLVNVEVFLQFIDANLTAVCPRITKMEVIVSMKFQINQLEFRKCK